MVVLLSHFPGKKIAFGIFTTFYVYPVYLIFRTELLVPLTCGNLILEGP